MGWGGRREGAGRPKGLVGKTAHRPLAEIGLTRWAATRPKGLARLGRQATAAGDLDLAIKAYGALLPFRWPKLKESQIDLGLGLSGSIADRLAQAQARLQITVVSGIDRPPDDPVRWPRFRRRHQRHLHHHHQNQRRHRYQRLHLRNLRTCRSPNRQHLQHQHRPPEPPPPLGVTTRTVRRCTTQKNQ